jgi:hypothetical protein
MMPEQNLNHPGFDLPSSHGDLLVRQNFASKNQRFAEGKALFRASPEPKPGRRGRKTTIMMALPP